MNNSTNPTSKILQDYIKEQSDFLSSCRPPSYEESHFKQTAIWHTNTNIRDTKKIDVLVCERAMVEESQ